MQRGGGPPWCSTRALRCYVACLYEQGVSFAHYIHPGSARQPVKSVSRAVCRRLSTGGPGIHELPKNGELPDVVGVVVCHQQHLAEQ